MGADREVGLGLDFGRIRTSVNRKLDKKGSYLIRTRSSVLSVRGTEFAVTADRMSGAPEGAVRERTTTTVFEGKVEVASVPVAGKKLASTVLGPGGQITALAELSAADDVQKTLRAGLAKVLQLKPERLTAVQQESRVTDQTFTQAIVVGDHDRTRFRGEGTLAVAASSAAVPNLSIPRAAFSVPGTFTPSAQLLTGSQLDLFPVSVKVQFQ